MLLIAATLASLIGVHWFLYLSLPYLLLQQASYAIWLLGGGGVVLALLLVFVVAGVFLGPTSYCATLCPTGAVLSLLGRAKPVNLYVDSLPSCGSHCGLCNEACWLALKPASGNAGPDCDLCTRCFDVCPRSNLRIGLGKARTVLRVFPFTLFIGLQLSLALPAMGEAPQRTPRLLFESERMLAGVHTAISVVDLSGVALDADALDRLSGVEISVTLARGERQQADEDGLFPDRELYRGPLRLRIESAAEGTQYVDFLTPTSPISAPERTIYRRRLPLQLEVADQVILEPIEGWIREPFALVDYSTR